MRAILYSVVASIPVLAGWSLAVFVLQPFGHRVAAFAVIAVVLAGLLATLWRRHRPARLGAAYRPVDPGTTALALGKRARWRARLLARSYRLVGICSRRFDSAREVETGHDSGLDLEHPCRHRRGAPWKRHGWPVRRKALEAALAGTKPDILCVQEALHDQLASLAIMLPGHHRVGVGRDDGRSAGEHCAIFFDASRFEEVDGGTFWLEEPAEEPPTTLVLGPKRICTWVRLRDRIDGRYFRIYNTHLYLTELPACRLSG